MSYITRSLTNLDLIRGVYRIYSDLHRHDFVKRVLAFTFYDLKSLLSIDIVHNKQAEENNRYKETRRDNLAPNDRL